MCARARRQFSARCAASFVFFGLGLVGLAPVRLLLARLRVRGRPWPWPPLPSAGALAAGAAAGPARRVTSSGFCSTSFSGISRGGGTSLITTWPRASLHFHCAAAGRRGQQQRATRRQTTAVQAHARTPTPGEMRPRRRSVAVAPRVQAPQHLPMACAAWAIPHRPIRIIRFCVWSLSHAPSRQSAHLRRRVVGAGVFPGVAARHAPGHPAVPQHQPEPAAGVRRDGHRDRSAPGDRHRAGRRHRHRAQEHGAQGRRPPRWHASSATSRACCATRSPSRPSCRCAR